MPDYPLTWVTSHLAVGHAPMSYVELESIKQQGIDAIVNLCAEYSDLHEIEESSGFEVFFLPVDDETAPGMAQMETGLEWLDEAIYLGKKVLVHCRHGIGRTGTFVTAYLLRRGFSMNEAGKMLKTTRANPTNFSQWWLLRKYGKKEGRLTLQKPTPENRKSDDLQQFFTTYEQLLELVDRLTVTDVPCCSSGKGDNGSCSDTDQLTTLELIEAIYLHNKINITLSSEKRQELIHQTTRTQNHSIPMEKAELPETAESTCSGPCPLYQGAACLLQTFRPVSCRIKGQPLSEHDRIAIEQELGKLSRDIFTAVFGFSIDQPPPPVELTDVVSGRFIQQYFQFIATHKKKSQ